MANLPECKCDQDIFKDRLPLVCLIPRKDKPAAHSAAAPVRKGSDGGVRQQGCGSAESSWASELDPAILDLSEEYIKERFKLPEPASYLDPIQRPLISHPMSGDSVHFNIDKKDKINQMILDGILPAEAAISAPSAVPYGKSRKDSEKAKDEETIYILQLPDYEFKCPIHQTTVRTPRFLWHSVKKGAESSTGIPKKGPGILNRPKPWLLSRLTDFDLKSSWPEANPLYDVFNAAAPSIVSLNPCGRFRSSAPQIADMEKMSYVLQHFIEAQGNSIFRSVCPDCIRESKLRSGRSLEDASNYVPLIVVPIQSPGQLPADVRADLDAKMKSIEVDKAHRKPKARK